MNRYISLILIIIAGLVSWYATSLFAAALTIPGGTTIPDASILVNGVAGGSVEQVGQTFWLRILGLVKVVISGFALVFMVLIGVYMVIFSENEEKVKTQRKQITYTLIGFLFLNIPGILYQVMSPSSVSGTIEAWNWSDTSTAFWYTAGLPGFVGEMVGFFRVFAYGAAILMLTWGFFRLILSSGEEEQIKSAKSRVIYSSLALMFLLFIDAWVRMVSSGNLAVSVPGVAGTIFRLALFFAAPVAIFFIIYGAYYYITSAGDEERVKKGKNILINTFVAALILIAAFSFLSDLASFSF